jgi:hypothetical protein
MEYSPEESYICEGNRISVRKQKAESNSENTLTQRSIKEAGRTGRGLRIAEKLWLIGTVQLFFSWKEMVRITNWNAISIKSSRAVVIMLWPEISSERDGKLTENGVNGRLDRKWRGMGGVAAARSPTWGRIIQ